MWIITVSVDLSRFQAKSKSLAATEASSAGEASLSAEPPKDYCRVLVQGEFTVGRQTARRAGREPPLIEISGDKGVSRQQGVLVVSGNYDVRNALARSTLSWRHTGSTPSFVDRQKAHASQLVDVADGQSIAIGRHTTLTACYAKPRLVFCSSRITPSSGLPQLLEACAALGGTYQSTWMDVCTHLVVKSGLLSTTTTVLCALVTGANIVTPAWLDAAIDSIKRSKDLTTEEAKHLVTLPPPGDFPPTEKNPNGRLGPGVIKSNVRRRVLFKSLTFGFLSLDDPSLRLVELGNAKVLTIPGARSMAESPPSLQEIARQLRKWAKQGIDFLVARNREHAAEIRSFLQLKFRGKNGAAQEVVVVHHECIASAIVSADLHELKVKGESSVTNAPRGSNKLASARAEIATGQGEWTTSDISPCAQAGAASKSSPASPLSLAESEASHTTTRRRQNARSMLRRKRMLASHSLRQQHDGHGECNGPPSGAEEASDAEESNCKGKGSEHCKTAGEAEALSGTNDAKSVADPNQWICVGNDHELSSDEGPSRNYDDLEDKQNNAIASDGQRFFLKNRVPPAPRIFVHCVGDREEAGCAGLDDDDSLREVEEELSDGSGREGDRWVGAAKRKAGQAFQPGGGSASRLEASGSDAEHSDADNAEAASRRRGRARRSVASRSRPIRVPGAQSSRDQRHHVNSDADSDYD